MEVMAEVRREVMFDMTAVKKVEVVDGDVVPVHKPLRVHIDVGKIVRTTTKHLKTTDAAALFKEKV